uniref:Phospholipid/glycerol acyltransferase domain-containing protein n=2 Tax=Rhodosorus marinus TaxID=101924 RepID=A0A7S2ZLJ6_9RHOD|mmetsp:Transcript_24016/g.94587  ORF Transcript_24016/g.94587 Transcript_24016/m.94587 type:complete len:486 (+) Transcript_24016:383-1840(+)|eukprot:CAMPEP_0113960056 /NCGR_PEP_ID=MMETSP0011_2-20120614/4496_1 /TAXON_ID=101924 /ORGANISM="Rhodosorus marinus" /LENGTH=485 /DNA_ID=CAMNT_0000971453 /DNA_START=281 /DNA_END=1738 /DNA_ORIENTATION=+ /assembly_acc=CAM_ASM_000156
MLSIRNLSIIRTTYLFILNLCGRIIYGREAVEPIQGDALLNSSEVTRIRRINSELEIGPKEWESLVDRRSTTSPDGSKLYTIEEVASCFCDAGEALAGDSLTAAFSSVPPEPWNFMLRSAGPAGIPPLFFPLWAVGAWVRYCVLLPVRIGIIVWGTLAFCFIFFSIRLLIPPCRLKMYMLKRSACFYASVWVASFGGIIRYHGKRPKREANQIYVSNHTSLIDVMIMIKDYSFSCIGQRHPGLVGALEDLLLTIQSHVWFDRAEGRDRRVVHTLLKAHTENEENEPMLVFPEGTCVNNEYCIMFKKGCFELGARVYPVAIKYNKQFSDPYWNSSQVSFQRHLLDLMTSWAVVADVYYLPPESLQPGETSAQFAARVKKKICEKADLIDVNWDGFLKRHRISPKFMEQRQKSLADVLIRRMYLKSKSASVDNLDIPLMRKHGERTPADEKLAPRHNDLRLRANGAHVAEEHTFLDPSLSHHENGIN